MDEKARFVIKQENIPRKKRFRLKYSLIAAAAGGIQYYLVTLVEKKISDEMFEIFLVLYVLALLAAFSIIMWYHKSRKGDQ